MVSPRSFSSSSGPLYGQALVQALLGDLTGGGGHGPQRAEHPAGHQPAQPDRDQSHNAQGDGGLDQQVRAARPRSGGWPRLSAPGGDHEAVGPR